MVGEISSILASQLGFLPSLDQPIRSGEHLRRNLNADLLCRLEIDHQLELRRLLDGQIGRLGSLQYSVYVICDAPVAVRDVRPGGHEPTGIYIFSVVVHRR
jgi:hypothetical protein